jgi:D-2-hydroxyacid dehydrogenase (NADP+)
MVSTAPFPSAQDVVICFAHVAYQLEVTYAKHKTGLSNFQVWTPPDLQKRIGEADVLVVSGFWSDTLLQHTSRLKFIQSIGAGYDQFPLEILRKKGIRLANASGVNTKAVSEHALALILALARQIHTGRDNQQRKHWRGMISEIARREDELGGKTVVIVGFGAIGTRIAKLAKAFDMHVIAIKRNVATADSIADEVYTPDDLLHVLQRADYVVLSVPLTPQTTNIIDASALSAMPSSSHLINVARGGCVDEDALIDALQQGSIAGAGLDVTQTEPLPDTSDLWAMENVILTPHTAGETRRYEENVIDILTENIDLLQRNQATLRNQII